jgi:hypothetical protein
VSRCRLEYHMLANLGSLREISCCLYNLSSLFCVVLLTFFACFGLVQGIAEALGKAGAVYKYDFSLPPKYFYKIVEDLRGQLGKSISLFGNWDIFSIRLHGVYLQFCFSLS